MPFYLSGRMAALNCVDGSKSTQVCVTEKDLFPAIPIYWHVDRSSCPILYMWCMRDPMRLIFILCFSPNSSLVVIINCVFIRKWWSEVYTSAYSLNCWYNCMRSTFLITSPEVKCEYNTFSTLGKKEKLGFIRIVLPGSHLEDRVHVRWNLRFWWCQSEAFDLNGDTKLPKK